MVYNQIIILSEMNIRGTQIKDLITKFYYKNNDLCFQILLLLKDNVESVSVSEHTDYTEYKKVYDQLIHIKSNDLSFSIPSINQKNIKSILA